MEKAMILFSVLLLGWTWTLLGVPVDGDHVEPSVAPAEVEDPTVNATLLNTTLLNPRTTFLFNATEICEQAPETGPCDAYIPRYFYNSSSMSCQLFTYGGCRGNRNNFQTEKECMERCDTEGVCEQAPETGPCLAGIPRYFYNSSSMSCQLFTYGGCLGNQNNFQTETKCMQRCHTEGVCEQAPETGPCKAAIPRYFYNSSSMSCQLFTYGGCRGNRNNFQTEKECMQRCRTKEKSF
ncbi:carboxypeptidase inhibitor SmCI isoform X2 [Etheostoma spectabile]|uniref:carboxypeptidase inhibitor SmCI isoform X2 n=1 Tax=Etheostoma spectabile TaxID=54343 RepID=UPI0013AED130|nr:carboxypeptidase inhibitor SmCI-like isoform X2 [Etheostoma spectabile]